MEVATGVAHPPGGLHHNNKILLDYTRVEVHTVKSEFMQWRIDYTTPEGLVLLRDVMGQFILWHKQDTILTISSPHPPLPNLERVVEVRRYFHHLVTTTFLRCHILSRLLASMCLLQLIPSKCMIRCQSSQ